MLNIFRKKTVADFFTKEEKALITTAIKSAEKQTSGEVKVYIEGKCSYVDAIDRAAELFNKLQLYKTVQKNAVIVYIALFDKQLAIFGDKGIHEKVGTEFWNQNISKMIAEFNKNNYAQGIADVVTKIGNALAFHFPFLPDVDINEIPDDIEFGN